MAMQHEDCPQEGVRSSLGGSSSGKTSSSRSLASNLVASMLLEEGEQLAFHPVTLVFRNSAIETEFLQEVSASRWPVMVTLFLFDLVVYLMRYVARVLGTVPPAAVVVKDFVAQLCNMLLLYLFMGLLNRRSQRSRSLTAVKQEEVLLALLMSLAISMLLLSLKPHSRDYVYAAFFLICATPLLKIRWLVGTAALAAPVALAAARAHLQLAVSPAAEPLGITAAAGGEAPSGTLPLEAVVHLLVAWAVGGLMSFLLDTSRRQAFVHHTLALAAAEKELQEMRARAGVERELAAAQAQAAARALVVAREKASNEAKSEFMSLMCHEVRTPLNGCLASAEMLLETDLTAEQHDLARTIRVSGSILLSTVSNFLDFFKMEAGKQLDIVRTPLDLRGLVGDVHCIIEAMIGRDGAVALLDPDLSHVPGTVVGDPNRVCGILLNLYTNAAKFTKQGAIGLRVCVVEEGYSPDVDTAVKFYNAALGLSDTSSASDALASCSLTSSPFSSPRDSQEEPSEQLGEGGNGPPSSPPAGEERRPSQQPSRQGSAQREGSTGGLLDRDGYPIPRPSLQYESQWRCTATQGEGPEEGRHGGGRGSSDGDSAEAAGGDTPTGLPSGVSQARRTHSGGPKQTGSNCTPSPAYPATHATHRAAAAAATASPPGTAGFMRSSAEFDSAQSLPAAVLLAQHTEAEVVAARAGHPHQSCAGMELCHLGDGWTSVCSKPAAARSRGEGGRSSSSGDGGGSSQPRRWLAFEVQDTGVGVASRGMDSLFQDYVQGTDIEMRRARSRGGTGLGLSICSKQVAVLGGQIGALSKPNCGSVFWFTIPLRVPAGAPAAPGPHPAPTSMLAGTAPTAAAAAAAASARAEAAPAGHPRPLPGKRNSLEVELTHLWGLEPGDSSRGTHGGSRRSSFAGPLPAAAAPRDSSDAALGSSFGWYHLPPGGPGRTAAARLQQHPEDAPSAAAAPAGAGSAAFAAAGGSPPGAAGGGGLAASWPPGSSGSQPGPVAAAPAAPLAHPTPAASGAYAHAGRGYGLWVLLAEDNLINQTVAKKMLSALGMKCEVAANGREAVTAVQRAHESGMNFDVVLMDMCMPVLDGVDATKAIRQLGCVTPIVAMTANASERDRQECLSAGMNGFLSKPVLKDSLLDAIMTATQGSRQPLS